MDSRKILEIYKRINDRGIKLASAWPTVADIPPGLIVRDSDGVVKIKVGDFLIPVPVTIIGSGPLANAPVASAANQNLFYMSTDFGLCKYVSVFNNAGSDWINCGVLPYVEDAVANNSAITLECVFATASIGANMVPAVIGGLLTETNLSLKVRDSGLMWANVGSQSVIGNSQLIANRFYRAKASRNNTTISLCYNDLSFVRSVANSLAYPNKPFLIGGHLSNAENFEGQIAKVRVYSGYSATCDVSSLVLLDEWDFNTWAGGLTGSSLMGYPFTVVDGTPETRLGYRCIPWSVLQ